MAKYNFHNVDERKYNYPYGANTACIFIEFYSCGHRTQNKKLIQS